MARPKDDKLEDAFARLAQAERAFVGTEFLAPALRGGRVAVRIAGVVCELNNVTPADFTGFGIFRADSHERATLVRPATMGERRRYLQLFPRVSLVVSAKSDRDSFAVPLNSADARFSVQGEVTLRFAEDNVQLFDVVSARFDGTSFWFDQPDPRADPAAAPYLRQALVRMLELAKLDRPGLMPGQRTAYALRYRARLEQMLEDARTRDERRLRDALEHAGAALRDFAEQRDEYRVTYEVDGERYVSVVRKGDLTVQTAGICLSGLDQQFDLTSLVSVMRQAEREGET